MATEVVISPAEGAGHVLCTNAVAVTTVGASSKGELDVLMRMPQWDGAGVWTDTVQEEAVTQSQLKPPLWKNVTGSTASTAGKEGKAATDMEKGRVTQTARCFTATRGQG